MRQFPILSLIAADYEVPKIPKAGKGGKVADADISEQLRALRTEMFQAAENLEFERAAKLRDELKKLEALAGGKNGAAGSDGSQSPDALYDPYAGSSPKKTRGGSRGKTGSAKSSSAKTGSAKASAGSRGRWKR